MYILNVLIFYIIINTCNTQNDYWKRCDQTGIHIYEELGCVMIANNTNNCPGAYNCPPYVIPKGKCLFYGQELSVNEIANGSFCNRGCTCRINEEDGKGEFFCGLIIDCFFGPSQPDCYQQRDLRACCGIEVCPQGDVFTCSVDGVTYRDGERFQPNGTCWLCQCRQGFRGVNEEPYCIRLPCDTELRNGRQLEKQCAPLYRTPGTSTNPALCCPSSYICPEDVNEFKLIKSEVPVTSNQQCKFAEWSLNIGDVAEIMSTEPLSERDVRSRCECFVPPYIACKSI